MGSPEMEVPKVYEYVMIRLDDDGKVKELITKVPVIVLARDKTHVMVQAGNSLDGTIHPIDKVNVLVRPFRTGVKE